MISLRSAMQLIWRSESWAFFYDNASTPSAKRHHLIPDPLSPETELYDTPAVQVARPHLVGQGEPSNDAILAEIRKLQQELDETRRSQYPFSTLFQYKSAMLIHLQGNQRTYQGDRSRIYNNHLLLSIHRLI